MQFNNAVATRLNSVPQAVLLANIAFWVEHNALTDNNFFDGRYWTYNSYEAFTVLFPYWGVKVIRNALKSLVDNGYLDAGQYAKKRSDRRFWYTLTDSGVDLLNTPDSFIVTKGQIKQRKGLRQDDDIVAISEKQHSTPIMPKGQMHHAQTANVPSCQKGKSYIEQIINTSIKHTEESPVCVQKVFEEGEEEKSQKLHVEKEAFTPTTDADLFAREFLDFETAYPKPVDAYAKKIYVQARKNNTAYEDILAGATAYTQSLKQKKKSAKFATKASDWLASEAWKTLVACEPSATQGSADRGTHSESVMSRITARLHHTGELISTCTLKWIEGTFILEDGRQLPDWMVRPV
jgi:hypothetical protein